MKNIRLDKIIGITDDIGNKWYEYKSATGSCYFSAKEIQNDDHLVMLRISKIARPLLTSASKNEFRRRVEEVTKFRPRVLAASPGWHKSVYVTAGGRPIGKDADQVLVTFDGRPKFTPHGNLSSWQKGIGCIVANQDLLLFILCYSLIAPLLRLSPSGDQNLQCELAGGPESGKSITAMLAASVWSGDPSATTGGCETWDLTLNALDPLKVEHSDGLLVLDETNLAGSGTRQSELLNDLIFKASTSGVKRRFTDTNGPAHSRMALLSTSNEPIKTLIRGAKATKSARESRMVSILIPQRSSGVLSGVPEGFESTRSAMEELAEAINQNYGAAGTRFIEKLTANIAADSQKLNKVIKSRMKKYQGMAKCAGIESTSARKSKLFEMTYVAGLLARKWNIFPQQWGDPNEFVLRVHKMVIDQEKKQYEDSFDKIFQYIDENRDTILEVTKLKRPLKEFSFNKKTGFLRNHHGKQELLIPTAVFRQVFADSEALMRELRDAEVSRGEGAAQKKLSIKTPKSICDKGRVYCIDIDALAAKRDVR